MLIKPENLQEELWLEKKQEGRDGACKDALLSEL